MTPTPERYNVAQSLNQMAEQAPFRPAIIFPAGRDKANRGRYVQFSFQQLHRLTDQYAHGLRELGIAQGERTLLMIRPGVELVAVTFALLKMGAVPVLIDPGMGRQAFLQCVQETEATAFIGIPLAHALRRVFNTAFKRITKTVVVGKRSYWAGPTLESLRAKHNHPFELAPTTPESPAAVAFTSGSTGIPKGVVYQHSMFRAQIEAMRHDMNVTEGEIHLAAVYIFALFNPALGVTTVIPDMNPAKTAALNPAWLVEAIQTHGVTLSVGSPTVWRLINAYCQENGLTLPSFKHVFMFGAPVPPSLIESFATRLAPDTKIYTPFGATEALPLTMIEAQEILSDTAEKTAQGAGVCVGQPVRGVDIRIIPISDDPIPNWQDSLTLPAGQLGEIVVKGPMVTHEYLNRPAQTAQAKIYDNDAENGSLWHRMGDVGYVDDRGRLWMCGRKSHRVETASGLMLPVPCEAIFNQHPAVARTALVGVGDRPTQEPILVVELTPSAKSEFNTAAQRQHLITALLKLGAAHEHTAKLQTILFHPDFPVDVRHNAKIQREKLAVWASKRLGLG